MLRETIMQASLQRTLQQANIHDCSVPPTKQLWDRSVQFFYGCTRSTMLFGRFPDTTTNLALGWRSPMALSVVMC
jgi:hypothetical protein